jgi:hypothetical protein
MRLTPVIAILLGGASVAWADAPPRYARRCTAGAPELPAARTLLARLDQAITRAALDAPAAPLTKELDALLATPCFRVAEALGEPAVHGASTLALKRWWKDGGHAWLGSELGADADATFPPTLRETLVLDGAAKHPLARLLCKTTDAACGAETAGWIARAERAFQDRAEKDARWRGSGYTMNLYARSAPPKDDADASPRMRTLDAPLWQCAFPAKGKQQQDFEVWEECVSALRVSTTLFPVGAFRAPTSGWFVVRGRRGHYQFCDQLTAFDLATGAYYASKSCSGLALRTNGAVDAAKTDAARTPVIETGRVSVDTLREAAWMIMLAPHVDATGYASASTFPIPPGLDVKVAIGDVRGGSAGSAWGSSAQTRLAWTWIDGAAIVADGILTWPDSYRDAETHAAELLRIAEAGLVAGCPPAPLPGPIVKGCGKGGVSAVDTSPASVCKVQAELSAQLAKLSGSGCRR